MQYIEKLMNSKEFSNSKFVIAWGNSMQNSKAVEESKVCILNMFLKHCPKNKFYQLTTMDKNIEATPAPHPLFLGIRASSSVWGLQEFKVKKPSQAITTKTKGKINFQTTLKSIKLLQANNKVTPIINPIISPVTSSSLNKSIKQGTMINKVHQPSNNKLILVIFNSFNPSTTPTNIKTIPHKILLIFISNTS